MLVKFLVAVLSVVLCRCGTVRTEQDDDAPRRHGAAYGPVFKG
jgi:hypothetical protein